MPVRQRWTAALTFPAFVLLAACALPGQAHAVKPPDLITPSAADAIAGAALAQRITNIKAKDITALEATETGWAVQMDVDLAYAYANTQAGQKYGPTAGVSFSSARVIHVDSYVAHQSAYPATFVSLLQFDDGTRSLLGFKRMTTSDRWRITVQADLAKDANPGLSRDPDGFAPQPQTSFPYQLDPAALIAYYLDDACSTNPACALAPGAMQRYTSSGAPVGYRPGIVTGQLAESRISQIVSREQQFRPGGFSVVNWAAEPLGVWGFPWYRTVSGGLLGFVSELERFTIASGAYGHCFTVAYPAEYLNAMLDKGTYYSVEERQANLLAISMSSSTGPLTIEGAASFVASNFPDSSRC